MKIVLVHGAGGTPTTWSEVAPRLLAAGHEVVAVTNPMRSLTGDVANTSAAIDAMVGMTDCTEPRRAGAADGRDREGQEGIPSQHGMTDCTESRRAGAADGREGEEGMPGRLSPVLLVGHSYGGAVITNAGRHPAVVGLVYVAAFGPDEGETVNQIVERYPPAEVAKYMRRGPNGEWASEHTDEYWAEVGWDLTAAQRDTFHAGARASENAIFTQPTGRPAWRTLPSWYLVAQQDRTLRPEIQRDMAARMDATVTQTPGSHFTPLVRPAEVVALIEQATGHLATTAC
jgi:pimeloyl-ACP methyl ester carboxylesterase